MGKKWELDEREYKELLRKSKKLKDCNKLLKILPDIVYNIDKDGKILYINDAVRVLGYSPKQLIGKHFSVLIHADDFVNVSRIYMLPRFKGKVTGALKAPKLFDERRAGPRMTKNLVVRLLHRDSQKNDHTEHTEPDDNTIYGEVFATGQFFCDETFKPENSATAANEVAKKRRFFQGTVGVIRNITERKQLELQKERLQERLFHAQKMEAIGQLASGIAHEFSNIMSAISGYASLIERKYASNDERLKKYVSMIGNAANRASDLTEELLTFTEKGSLQIIPVDIHEIIFGVKKVLDCAINQSIKIVIQHKALHSTIYGDPDLLKNVILNIALNARDALVNGGEITISTTNVILDENTLKMFHKKKKASHYLKLSIKDNGIGMDRKTKTRIFEPFFTTKPKGEGTGLGLATVYGIIENHNGFIEVESSKDVGTKIILYLPIYDAAFTTS